MSDSPMGEGWWLAVDGKYYAPELHPDFATPPPQTPPPYQDPAFSPTLSNPISAGGEGPAVEVPADLPTGLPLGLATTATAEEPPAETGSLGQSDTNAPSPWYRTWFAIVPGLLLCFPVGLVLLWTSRKQKNWKVGISVATALLVLAGALSSAGTVRPSKENAAAELRNSAAANVPVTKPLPPTTTTLPPTTTTLPPTTTTLPPTSTTLPPPPPPPPPPPTLPPTVQIAGEFRYAYFLDNQIVSGSESCENPGGSYQVRIADGANAILGIATFGPPATLDRTQDELALSYSCLVTYSATVNPSGIYTVLLSSPSNASEVFESQTFNGASGGQLSGPTLSTFFSCIIGTGGCQRS